MTEPQEAENLPTTLGGVSLQLVQPPSLAERWDVAILGASMPDAMHRVWAAALGICWPQFRRRHPYRGDALAYSQLVLDTLLRAGVSFRDISAPGMVALRLATEGLTAAPIEGAEGFSGTPAAGASAGAGS